MDNEFDDLFQNVQNSSLNMLNDSKIRLVDQTDISHPLAVGEFYNDNDEHTLYVGKLEGDARYDWLSHQVSFLYVPAPRLNISIEVELPEIEKSIEYLIIEPPRVAVNNNVDITTERIFNVAKTNRTLYSVNVDIDIPEIVKESEVQ